jgi:hypothetical protein
MRVERAVVHAVLAAALGCSRSAHTMPGRQPLPASAQPRHFERLYDDADFHRCPATMVARDSVAWAAAWECATAGHLRPRAWPEPDFSRDTYVLVAAPASSNATAMRVESVHLLRDTLVVRATHQNLCSLTQQGSRPVSVVRTARWDGPVRFEVHRITRPCGP